MKDLLRALAPIAESAWRDIDHEIKSRLEQMLAARKVVDFCGPLGWETAAIGTGRVESLADAPNAGVEASRRLVRPLVELRAPFDLAREELEAIARGAKDPDLDAAVDAARAIAIAEDRAIFHGYAAGGIEGICEAAVDAALPITDEYERYPAAVAKALNRLKTSGVGGSYAIALGPRCYTGLTQTTVGGFPVFAHVERLVDGPAVWTPGLDGAVVLSMRGGDFELTVGRDLSVGYLWHSETTVRLYIEESLTFRVLTPEAAVPLVYEKTSNSKRKRPRRA